MKTSRKVSMRRYYLAHKEQARLSSKKWKHANKDKVRIAEQIKYAKHPSLVNYKNMMTRCYNPQYKFWKYYGGKGILVYFDWHTFKQYEKDFGHTKPGKGYTVDRIDSSGHYEPGNVRWLTQAEQNRSH